MVTPVKPLPPVVPILTLVSHTPAFKSSVLGSVPASVKLAAQDTPVPHVVILKTEEEEVIDILPYVADVTE